MGGFGLRFARSESDDLNRSRSPAVRIQAAFEQAGIQFIGDDEMGGFGLRMAKKKRKPPNLRGRALCASCGFLIAAGSIAGTGSASFRLPMVMGFGVSLSQGQFRASGTTNRPVGGEVLPTVMQFVGGGSDMASIITPLVGGYT